MQPVRVCGPMHAPARWGRAAAPGLHHELAAHALFIQHYAPVDHVLVPAPIPARHMSAWCAAAAPGTLQRFLASRMRQANQGSISACMHAVVGGTTARHLKCLPPSCWMKAVRPLLVTESVTMVVPGNFLQVSNNHYSA